MGKGRGGGKTPERVVELIRKAVAEKSQSAVARESGLTLLTVQRYLKGIGEPTTKTLEKLSDYFNVSVPWLRGESGLPYPLEVRRNNGEWIVESFAQFLVPKKNQAVVLGKILEALKAKGGWGESGAYTALTEALGYPEDYTKQVISGTAPIREEFLTKMAECLEVSPRWLKGESSLSYEAETKWYKEQYKPGMDRVVAGMGAVGRFSEGLTEEELEVKLKDYEQKFPQVYAAMAEVPGERQQEVAEYVFVQASRYPGFVNPPPTEE